MQVMTKEREELLDDLMVLAYGDPLLVERSLAVWATPGKTLGDAIDYIKVNRDESRLTKSAA